MPGVISEFFGTDFLSHLNLFRTTQDSDVDPQSVAIDLDFTHSRTATENSVLIVPARTFGTGKINYQFYTKFSGVLAGLLNPWFLHKETGLQSPHTLVQVDGLYGTVYRVVVTHEDGPLALFKTYLSSTSAYTFVVPTDLDALGVLDFGSVVDAATTLADNGLVVDPTTIINNFGLIV